MTKGTDKKGQSNMLDLTCLIAGTMVGGCLGMVMTTMLKMGTKANKITSKTSMRKIRRRLI